MTPIQRRPLPPVLLARKAWICRLFHRHRPRLARQPDGTPAWECITCLRRWHRLDTTIRLPRPASAVFRRP